jgi:hypothetical protein
MGCPVSASFTIPLTVRPGSEDAQLAARKMASHKIAGRALVNIVAVLSFSLILLVDLAVYFAVLLVRDFGGKPIPPCSRFKSFDDFLAVYIQVVVLGFEFGHENHYQYMGGDLFKGYGKG